jgi:hypothetical protein
VLLLSEGNLFVEQVLRSLPGIEVIRGQIDRPLPTQPYDLYVFDGVLPAALPDGDLFIINPPRATPLFTVGEAGPVAGEITVASDDERMAFVDFANVNILRARAVLDTGWATPLVESDAGPLLLAGTSQGRQIALLSFDLRESDLPLNITWPVLVSNLLEWFTPSDVLTTSEALVVGDPVVARPPLDADRLRLTRPDGSTRDLPITRETIILTETDQPGLYRLEALAGDEVLRAQDFPVNLFAPGESDIAPREVVLGGAALSGVVGDETGQFELWPLAALLALLVLLIEWTAHHRRLQVRTLLNPGRPAPAGAGRVAGLTARLRNQP